MEKGNLKGMFVSGNIPAGAEYKAALKDVIQAFPYFQLAQVLFAKQLYDTHEPEASSRIKLASVYAPDRKAMYILFKKQDDKPNEQRLTPPAEVAIRSDKPDVKYNFVYSSTISENAEVIHTPIKKEEEPVPLSEAFIREEKASQPFVETPPQEQEKVAASAIPKVEDKKPETPKIQPFISVSTPVEKASTVEENKTEEKKPETPNVPAKKPYLPPTIEKKKSLYTPKKTEPEVAKPLVSINPPVEVKPPVIEKKPEEKLLNPLESRVIAGKPEPVKAEKKKVYTSPNIELKQPEEKKVQPPIVKPIVTIKPPIEVKPPVIEKKKEEKLRIPAESRGITQKPVPVDASGRKPYTKPTIVWKKSLYTNKPPIKKVEPPTIEKPVAVKPPIDKVLPVIEKKPEEKIIEKPKVEEVAMIHAPVETTKPIEIIEAKIEELKPQVEVPVIIETKVPVREEIPIIQEEKIGVIEVQPTPIIEEIKVETELITPEIHVEPLGEANLKYSFSSWLKVLPEIGVEKKEEIKPLTPVETSSIIDRFLQKESSISRPKAEFFSPVKAAKMSITEDDNIVSETLAKIYFEQGNLPKALKAYQTLLLQFPEKKNIFAPRIEKIKALIRENSK